MSDYDRWYAAGRRWAAEWTAASEPPGGVPDAWFDGFLDALREEA